MKGASFAVQRVKPFHIRVLATPLLTPLPVHVPGRAGEDGPRILVPANNMADPDGTHTTVGTVPKLGWREDQELIPGLPCASQETTSASRHCPGATMAGSWSPELKAGIKLGIMKRTQSS